MLFSIIDKHDYDIIKHGLINIGIKYTLYPETLQVSFCKRSLKTLRYDLTWSGWYLYDYGCSERLLFLNDINENKIYCPSCTTQVCRTNNNILYQATRYVDTVDTSIDEVLTEPNSVILRLTF